MRRKVKVILYTREDCGLCAEAKELLSHLSEEFPLMVTEIDIAADGVLYERYKHSVPVVAVEGEVVLGGRLKEEMLIPVLQEARRRG